MLNPSGSSSVSVDLDYPRPPANLADRLFRTFPTS
jgi:hypothetical protein